MVVRLSFVLPSSPSSAVTVMEYSVPSCRSVSVYIVSLAAIPVMTSESVKQSVLVLEKEMVYSVTLNSSSSVHEMVREELDVETSATEKSSTERENIVTTNN